MGRHLLPAVLLVLIVQAFLVRGIDLNNLQEHKDEFHPDTHLSIHGIPKANGVDDHVLHQGSGSPVELSDHKYCHSTKCTLQYLRYKHNYSGCHGCESVCKTTVIKYCHTRCERQRYGLCRYCKKSKRYRKSWRRHFAGTEVRKDDEGETVDKYQHDRRHYRGWSQNKDKSHYYRGTEYDRKGRLKRTNHDGSEEDVIYRKRHHQRQGFYDYPHHGIHGYYRASQSVSERHSTKKVCYKRRCRLQYLKEGRCHGGCHGCTTYCKKFKIQYCHRCRYHPEKYCKYCKPRRWSPFHD